ncbi:MAG: hypothetical protein NQU48_03120 [Hadesarchaea archaeon]|nr:hypothetical protein [Hadesarchaea archaeon]
MKLSSSSRKSKGSKEEGGGASRARETALAWRTAPSLPSSWAWVRRLWASATSLSLTGSSW